MTTILVVDDSAVIRRTISYTLRKAGYFVLTANNGHEGLTVLAEQKIDLIITDLKMPGMDGVALLQTLRADSRYKQLPVIMLTVSGQVQDRDQAETHGADGFLTKPASSLELVQTVKQFV